MKPSKIMSAEEAVGLVPDGATVAVIGGGGGLVEPSTLLSALERRFLESARPRDLTVVHSLGIGDRKTRGMNCFAYEGMVKRVIGGHWVWSPRMQQLAGDEKIEAYVLPGGVTMQLFREIGAGRPGLLTHVGLGTFVDPRQGGGRMNRRATDTLVEVRVPALIAASAWLRAPFTSWHSIITVTPPSLSKPDPVSRAVWGALPSKDAGSMPSKMGGLSTVTVTPASSSPTVPSGLTRMRS